MGKYIIELKRGETAYKTVDSNGTPLIQLLAPTPYAAPDLEQIRKETYKEGREAGIKDGMCEAWEVARKITDMTLEEQGKIFGTVTLIDIISKFTASEAIEKLKAYEQEKTKVEYNFEEVKDVIETTAKEYNMSLDEIAEVLQKMRENNG